MHGLRGPALRSEAVTAWRRTVGYALFPVWALGILALGILLLRTSWLPGVGDVNTWHWAGETIREGGGLYTEAPGISRYYGTPAFAAVWGLLGLLPRATAFALWLAVVWGSMLTAAWTLARIAGRGWWLLGVAPFALSLVGMGQVDAIVVTCVAGAALLLATGRGRTAGVLVAVAALVKVYPLALIPVLWLRRHRKAAAWAAGAAGAVSVVLPLLWIPPTEIVGLHLEQALALLGAPPTGRSLATIFPPFVVRLAGLGMYALALVDAHRRRNAHPIRPLGLALVAVMLASPVLWGYSACMVALVLGALVRERPRLGTAAALAFGVLGVLTYYPFGARVAWAVAGLTAWWVAFLADRRQLASYTSPPQTPSAPSSVGLNRSVTGVVPSDSKMRT